MTTTQITTDDLLRASRTVILGQFGSVSMIQRKLNLSLATANTIMDRLEERGIVGPSCGSRARDVLVKVEQMDGALAAVAAGRKYAPDTADGVPVEQRSHAAWRVYLTLAGSMPEDQAEAAADRAVDALVDAGWRPTR